MSKTIEQLRAEAALIEDAVRQGENTQVRVGGLFQDIIDFIAQIPITETVLGPLLQALNNSELINPGDGQTLTFSLMKEGWTFSDALTQLQIRLGQISSTVTSNYEAFLQTKNLLQAEVAATDERVRNYKTEYDQSQLEYATWKSQTDTSISQYAVAIDRNTRNIVSISGRVDTAFDQLDFVTNDLEAADKNIGKIFDLAGMNLSDEPSASWLYKNKDGIYGAAATFDASGNIKDLSTLDLTIKGFNTRVTNAEHQVSQIDQTVDSIQLAVAGDQQQITTLNGYINGTAGNPGLIQRMSSTEGKLSVDEAELNRHASAIEVNRQGIAAVSAKFNPDGSLANTSGLVASSDFSELFTEAYDDTGAQSYMAQLRTDLTGVTGRVSTTEGQVSELSITTNQISQTVNDPKTGIGALNVKADSALLSVTTLDGWVATMGPKIITVDNVQKTLAEIKANILDFDFTDVWTVSSKGKEVMRLDTNGNLTITGTFNGNITNSVTGSSSKKMYIKDSPEGAYLMGVDGDEVLRLGFMTYNGSSTSGMRLVTKMGGTSSYSYYYNDMLMINNGTYWLKAFTTDIGTTLQFERNSATGFILRYDNKGKLFFYIPKENLYNHDTASPGCIYLDGDVLKYKTY